MHPRARAAITIMLAAAAALLGRAAAQNCGPPESGPAPGMPLCPDAVGPDVIVGEIPEILRFGTVGTRTSYAIGTTACNYGDAVIAWQPLTANHPVIIQNMYRIDDLRIEQIGMSWAKHGFTVFQDLCCCDTCIDPQSFEMLGVGCSDTYNSAINGSQGGFNGRAGLGPRSDINPATGAFPFPYTTQGQTGDALYKRLQVEHDELDPAMNTGAQYVVEAQYISADDAAAGNGNNNASWAPLSVVSPDPEGGWELIISGATTPFEPAIYAWADADPAVQIAAVDVPGDGRFLLGWKATDNGDGTWRYEYALQNLNSHRAARRLIVPDVITNVANSDGFHDIHHHSGEPYDTTDWSFIVDASASWQCPSFATDPDANALRWGTLYNFWFDATTPPEPRTLTITLFRPGMPSAVNVAAVGPAVEPVQCPADIAGNDNVVDVFDLFELLNNWGAGGSGADLAAPLEIVDVFDLFALLGAWGPC